MKDRRNTGWRRSSYSGANGECLEIGHTTATEVPVRDSKRPARVLSLNPAGWAAFIQGVKQDRPS
ncbi:DUF397 domain-containing protein [Streptomyces sp. MS19]|uniref:DUF397 domain-containing protein n=1 Tax=Streptomyces sp. MS19 TaxID=3385972 RepID=UPI0039A172FD